MTRRQRQPAPGAETALDRVRGRAPAMRANVRRLAAFAGVHSTSGLLPMSCVGMFARTLGSRRSPVPIRSVTSMRASGKAARRRDLTVSRLGMREGTTVAA